MPRTETVEEKSQVGGSWPGGITPQEAARRSAESRRQKARARAEAAEAGAIDGARTFRQRLGVALSQLSQEELSSVVQRLAKAGNANALARLADQAFGRPSEQDEPQPQSQLGGLSRDELATALADLDALPSADPVHAGDTQSDPPHPRRR